MNPTPKEGLFKLKSKWCCLNCVCHGCFESIALNNHCFISEIMCTVLHYFWMAGKTRSRVPRDTRSCLSHASSVISVFATHCQLILFVHSQHPMAGALTTAPPSPWATHPPGFTCLHPPLVQCALKNTDYSKFTVY